MKPKNVFLPRRHAIVDQYQNVEPRFEELIVFIMTRLVGPLTKQIIPRKKWEPEPGGALFSSDA